MTRYTADALSLLAYLVDALPHRADRLYAEAEAGETIVQVPSTALAEALYAVSRDKNVRGVTLSGSPEEARRALVENGPLSVAPITDAELVEYTTLVGEFTIHDALVVASHLARGTDAIITTGGEIEDRGFETVWE